MKAATEQQMIRWMHLILTIPVLGYIYGPVAENPYTVNHTFRFLDVEGALVQEEDQDV